MKLNKILFGFAAAVTATGLAQAETVFSADYSTGQGYATGDLKDQNGWVGHADAQVDVSGVGSVSSVGGIWGRNMNNAGARGGTGGIPLAEGDFEEHDTLTITFYYQFTLSGDTSPSCSNVGIRDEGPNMDNGWSTVPMEGFQIKFSAWDNPAGTETDGNIQFYPDLNNVGDGTTRLGLEGLDVGVDPANATTPDLESDQLKIVYTATRDDAGTWTVTSFTVTNVDTAMSWSYGGDTQSFTWTATDAFYAQQLAINGDAGFTGTSSAVSFDYTPAPAVRPVFTIDYTTAEGYANGNLNGQNDWQGQDAPQVDVSGTGSVSSTGNYARNCYKNGILGGTAGVANPDGEFTPGEKIRVIFDYQFTLSGGVNTSLAVVGFREEGPNAGNGFEAAPEQGFSINYSQFNVGVNGGSVKFWPDTNDDVSSGADNANALLIDGNDLGVDPSDVLGNGVDLTSDPIRVFWTVVIGDAGTWTVDSMVVANMATSESWCYDNMPVQDFPWTATDAFYAQQYVRVPGTNPATGTTDRVQIDFLAIPDSTPAIDVDYTLAECYSNGNLQSQHDWNGQNIAQVDASGTGTVTSLGGPYDRNYWENGLLGGTAGVPNPSGAFAAGDVIDVVFHYQFTLSGDTNINLGQAGFRADPAVAGTPEQGFRCQYRLWDAGPDTDGNVQFLPDMNDTDAGDALVLEGLEVGIDPGSASPDLVSDMLRIDATYTHDGAGNFEATSFSVTNTATGSTYTYSGPAQSFPWTGTDAFFAQQLAPNGDAGFTGVTDGVTVSYTAAVTDLKITSVTFVDADTIDVAFEGAATTTYELYTSPDIDSGFTATAATAETDAMGLGTITYDLPGGLTTKAFLQVTQQ